MGTMTVGQRLTRLTTVTVLKCPRVIRAPHAVVGLLTVPERHRSEAAVVGAAHLGAHFVDTTSADM
jgi:hypothetical protein